MEAVVNKGLLAPIADDVEKRAAVRLIGYGGGGVRNLFANKPMKNVAEIKSLKVRVQGAPIWSRTFSAIGMSPTVIAYNEVYNAIQNNVISAAENEAAGIEQMKFYEVAPNILMTQHAVSIRPICFSMKTLTSLPKDLQDAVLQAGKEAAAYERQIEAGGDSAILERLEAAGRLKRIPFEDRSTMQKLAEPVMQAYAKEIEASGIQSAIAAA
jgi:TRAP-type C4-dicarboxylate transport system substrate-binding protein